jgi:hypothetical protein
MAKDYSNKNVSKLKVYLQQTNNNDNKRDKKSDK